MITLFSITPIPIALRRNAFVPYSGTGFAPDVLISTLVEATKQMEQCTPNLVQQRHQRRNAHKLYLLPHPVHTSCSSVALWLFVMRWEELPLQLCNNLTRLVKPRSQIGLLEDVESVVGKLFVDFQEV